jgi:hypothetical protein
MPQKRAKMPAKTRRTIAPAIKGGIDLPSGNVFPVSLASVSPRSIQVYYRWVFRRPKEASLARWSGLAISKEGNRELRLPSRGDSSVPKLGPLAGRSASFGCRHSSDNSPFRPAYHAACAPHTAGSLACPAALLPGLPPPSATYRTRNSSSLAARLAFSATRNTSCSTLRSPSLSLCSWHNSPSF